MPDNKPTEAKMDFETAIKRFIKHTAHSQEFARICAEMSIAHYEKHGDLSYCQRFLEAMPQNYVRRIAYVAWLANHAPVVMEEGKFLKDKSDKAVKFNLEGAMKLPFWDFAPEADLVSFSVADIDKAILGLLKKYRTSKRYVPDDKEAVDKHLEELEAALTPHLVPVYIQDQEQTAVH